MDALAPSTGDFSREAAQITMRETRDDDSKHALCVGALTAGCPDAFVDFHRLATADDGYGDDALTEEEAFELRIDIHADDYVKPEELPVEYARYVRDVLVRAEAAEDPSTAVPAARATLAAFFREKKDHEKASYFHQRDLDAAIAAGDVKAEVRAMRRLARERETQGAHVAAAAAFEKAAETAEREAERSETVADIGRRRARATRPTRMTSTCPSPEATTRRRPTPTKSLVSSDRKTRKTRKPGKTLLLLLRRASRADPRAARIREDARAEATRRARRRA